MHTHRVVGCGGNLKKKTHRCFSRSSTSVTPRHSIGQTSLFVLGSARKLFVEAPPCPETNGTGWPYLLQCWARTCTSAAENLESSREPTINPFPRSELHSSFQWTAQHIHVPGSRSSSPSQFWVRDKHNFETKDAFFLGLNPNRGDIVTQMSTAGFCRSTTLGTHTNTETRNFQEKQAGREMSFFCFALRISVGGSIYFPVHTVGVYVSGCMSVYTRPFAVFSSFFCFCGKTNAMNDKKLFKLCQACMTHS